MICQQEPVDKNSNVPGRHVVVVPFLIIFGTITINYCVLQMMIDGCSLIYSCLTYVGLNMFLQMMR